MQELFDAIVVNPYDEDAVADAIAAAWLTFTHVHSASQSPFPQSPRDIQLFFSSRINAILPALQIGLELTRGNRLSEDDLRGSNVCSTLHPPDIAVDSVLNVHRTRGGLPSECAKLCCKMMQWLELVVTTVCYGRTLMGREFVKQWFNGFWQASLNATWVHLIEFVDSIVLYMRICTNHVSIRGGAQWKHELSHELGTIIFCWELTCRYLDVL